MSFGITASSYIGISGLAGLVQQNSSIWTGTTMSVSLPSTTSPLSTIVLIIAGNTIVSTPSGWTLRESQVNMMGHYLFTRTGGTNSWNITTNSGAGTWYAAEVGGGYETSLSDNDSGGDAWYTTPLLAPTVGNRLLVASIGSVSDEPYTVRTVSDWTNDFTGVADICNATADYPMQGVAARSVTTDGVTSYETTATYSINSTGRSAIITSFTVS